jgi:long-subunit fatty acid transport protein
MRKHLVSSVIVVTWLIRSAVAIANTEPAPSLDARAVGMGSTGVAHVQNGASLYFNPATLQGIEQGSITLNLAPLAPQMTAPLAANGGELDSSRSVFPMFLVGGAYRLSQKFIVGLAAFPTMGFGAKYSSVPLLGGNPLNATLAAIEFAPGASYALTNDIAIGATYRVTYQSFTMEQPILAPDPAPPGTLVPTKLDVSGWQFLGVQLGLLARATKTTRVGLTYRNKVPVTMSGTTSMGGQSYHSEVEFASPHTFKAGLAQSFLDDRLLLALDLRLSLYKESSKDLTVKTDIPGAGTQSTTQPLNWKNIVGANVGAEYRFLPEGVAIRAGYGIVQSATPADYAQPILPPPGLQHSIHAGGGIAISSVNVDLGGYYLFGGKHAQPVGGSAGDYSMNAILVALAATYHW